MDNHVARTAETTTTNNDVEADDNLHTKGATTATPASSLSSSGLERFTRDEKYHLAGWGLFVISATFYIVAAIEFESWTSLIGGLMFLFACFAFMIPLIWKEKIS